METTKDKRVSVRLTDDEYAFIQKEAQGTGLSCSEYMRRTVTGLNTIAYDPEMVEAVCRLHEDSRRIAEELQRASAKNPGVAGIALAVRQSTDQLMALNGQLMTIVENLRLAEKKAGEEDGNHQTAPHSGE